MIPLRNEKDISGCAISGIISENGTLFSGEMIMESIANMRDRSSGLGGGFAAYGIYPDQSEDYAFHLMFDDPAIEKTTRLYIEQNCLISHDEPIPVDMRQATGPIPTLHRYFVRIRPDIMERYYGDTEDELITQTALHINGNIKGAFVFSSGKNMGIFKGVGFPEDIGRFFRLQKYNAYLWLAHGRFPTNTTGWWGGAHPFGLLDWSVVHNGEISSYGINKRYLKNFGYHCSLHTDTEVITYLFDLLIRKHKLPIEIVCRILAPPFWTQIKKTDADLQHFFKMLRIVYGGALLNGPFSIVVGYRDGMLGLNDRTKLRPMVAARSGDMLFMASEESALRAICPHPQALWHAEGGVPIVGKLKNIKRKKYA